MAYNYDEQIKRLTERPDTIKTEWGWGMGLFKFIGAGGCLTQIRSFPDKPAFTAEVKGKRDDVLTQAIASDERIPKYGKSITPKDLPVFKEWQEKIDKLQEP